MNGFDLAENFDSTLVEMIVLFLGATKTAYDRAGIDFDSLPEEQRIKIVYDLMTKGI